MVYRVEANNWDGSGQFQLNTENLSDILALVREEDNRQQYRLLFDERASITDQRFDFQHKCGVSYQHEGKQAFIKNVEHLISIGF